MKADQGEERGHARSSHWIYGIILMEHITQAEIIQVEVRRKEDGAYIEADGWEVSGDLELGQGRRRKEGRDAAVTITVPENTGEGTYRLIFKLGDKKALYNIIIRAATEILRYRGTTTDGGSEPHRIGPAMKMLAFFVNICIQMTDSTVWIYEYFETRILFGMYRTGEHLPAISGDRAVFPYGSHSGSIRFGTAWAKRVYKDGRKRTGNCCL